LSITVSYDRLNQLFQFSILKPVLNRKISNGQTGYIDRSHHSTFIIEFWPLQFQDVQDYRAHEEREFIPWLADELDGEGASDLENRISLYIKLIERKNQLANTTSTLTLGLPENSCIFGEHELFTMYVLYSGILTQSE